MELKTELLQALAKEYGTPLYIYNGDLVLKRLRELYASFHWKKLRLHYAMKANYCPAILKLLCQQGAGIDAVSPGDVILATRCGFSAERILFTANNITDSEMKRVHKMGVLFNIDSLSRLEKFGSAFPGAEVCLRFNPDVVAGENEKIQTAGALTKFGILLEQLPETLAIVQRYQLKVVGLHKHTGSSIKDAALFVQAMQNLLGLAKPEFFPHLRFVDFGGGFAVPYRPEEQVIDYAAVGKQIVACFTAFCDGFGRELELCFEPGRYLVAEAGLLVTAVNTLKNNKGRLIAGTDSGFPQLIRPVLYDAYHQISNLSNPSGGIYVYDICGNICESGDRFASDRPLPEIREGDLLAIHNAGAYCYAMGGIYNLRPMPAEVMVLKGRAALIRRRLTEEELVRGILMECE